MSPQEIFFRLTRLHRLLIVGALCLLLLVGFYFIGIFGLTDSISDMLSKIDDLEKSIAGLENQIKNEEQVQAEGPKLKAQIVELEKRLETMVGSLPEKQEIEALYKTITDLLSQTNLIAKRFTPGQEQVNEELFYARIPISMNVRGDYQKQGTFFQNLNDLPRIVNVPQLKLVKAGDLTRRESDIAGKLDIIALEAEITGETYRRLSPEETKAIIARKQQPKGGQKPGTKGTEAP